jgi:hypothetical protein
LIATAHVDSRFQRFGESAGERFIQEHLPENVFVREPPTLELLVICLKRLYNRPENVGAQHDRAGVPFEFFDTPNLECTD